MLDAKIKSIIDNARDVLVGKVPNPQSQIDLITIAMIYKFMDDMDNSIVKEGGKPSFFRGELEPYAWHKLLNPSIGNEGRISLYSEALEKLQISKYVPPLFRQIFKGAFLPFRDGATLTMFLKEIDKLSYDNSENLGNGFEYLLSIMGSQGDAGQFRTPRHIIDFIVDVVNPSKDDTILDPACGTAGFLISAYKHILKHNSEAFDPKGETKSYASIAQSAIEIDIEIEPNLNGDKLTPTERMTLTKNIKGYDISPDMQKLALVNLYLHGFKNPDISEYDTLTQETKWDESFDVILANPPFMTPKGGIKPHKKFSIQANRSEVLFIDYILEHLNLKGKAGIIVPEGIIFQSQTAYKKLRKTLIENNYLYAVVSLPSGVFQPYSGVKTSILLVDRELAKKTDSILFVDVKNDGYDLGAQRRAINKNDLPEAFKIIKEFRNKGDAFQSEIEKSEIANLVKKSKIAEDGDYNLSGSRYAETIDYSGCKWERVKLEEFATLINGRAYKQEELLETGPTPVLRVGNFFSNRNWYYSDLMLDDDKYCNNGDLLYAWSASFGPKIWQGPKAIYHYHIWKVVTKENINKKFLYYLLLFDSEKIKSEGNGLAMLHTTKGGMEKREFPLPPLEVQEEMVKELDAYQAVIDGAKKVVENWKPSIPTNPSWKQMELDKVCKKITDGTHSTPKYTEDGVPFLRVTDLTGSNDTKKFISEEEHRELIKRCKPENGDVLYSKNGTIGVAKQVDWDWEFSIFVSLCLLKPNKDILNSKYLELFMNSDDALSQAKARSKTGAITNLHLIDIKTIKIPLPSIEEQEAIVAKIKIEEQAIEQCKKLIELHEQKISDKIKSIWGEGCQE